jgi:hypothetical protein
MLFRSRSGEKETDGVKNKSARLRIETAAVEHKHRPITESDRVVRQ